MKALKFKRFMKPHFLKEIGRELLGRFFAQFRTEMAAKSVALPPDTVSDDAYFEAVATIAVAPEGLPEGLVEAVHAIEDAANEEGEERLERAALERGLQHLLKGDTSRADLAVKVWLEAPALLTETLNELRLARLTGFDYWGSKVPVDRSDAFAMPSAETIRLLTEDFEEAFRQRNRGQRTTKVTVLFIDGEYWVSIQHGDTYARVPTVIEGRVSVIHFRPAKEDLVVYSPKWDGIRIHAGTKWERELYRERFGVRLFGDDRHFSERKAYTLDPLLVDGVDALDVSDIDGIFKIVLREYEVAYPGEFNDRIIRKSDDIFASAERRGVVAIREGGRLVGAVFDVTFVEGSKPRRVQLRLPNGLKPSRRCDSALLERWLAARGFRVNVPGQDGSTLQPATGQRPPAPAPAGAGQPASTTHDEPVAVS